MATPVQLTPLNIDLTPMQPLPDIEEVKKNLLSTLQEESKEQTNIVRKESLALKKEVDKLNKRVENLAKARVDEQRRTKLLKTDLTAAYTELRERGCRLSRDKKEFLSKQDDRDRGTAAHIRRLKREVQRLKRDISELNDKLDSKDGQISTLSLELRETKKNLVDCSKLLEKEKERNARLRPALSTPPSCRTPDGRLDITEMRLEAARNKIRRLSTNVEDRVKEIHQLTSQLRYLRNERAGLRSSLRKISKKNKELSTRSKNRGTRLKKERSKSTPFILPKRRLKKKVSKRQQYRRRMMYERNMRIAHEHFVSQWGIDIQEYGRLEVKHSVDGDGEDDGPAIKLKKGSPVSNAVKKWLSLHDHGMSKKKIHEARQLAGESVPAVYNISKESKAMNEEIKSTVKITVDAEKFIADPSDYLKYVLEKRGIYDSEVHMMLEADGKGTGNSVQSVGCFFRIINEGRLMHRSDRCYLIAFARGKESYSMMQTQLKDMRMALKLLQEKGIDLDDPEDPGNKKIHVNVVQHLLADGKMMKLCSGMQEFYGPGWSCLKCLCPNNKRADVRKKWREYPNRWDNSKIGTKGRKKKDLFPWIPVERRWMENMHLVLRFLHDKLIAQAFTDIVNSEMGDEGPGMAYIANQMRGDEIKKRSFEFNGGESKDKSAEAKLTWSGLSYTEVLRVAKYFDFASGYQRNPLKGQLIQKAITEFYSMYKQLLVWPGDGPDVCADDIFEAHSSMLAEMLGQNPGELTDTASGGSADEKSDSAKSEASFDNDDSDEGSDESALPGEHGHVNSCFPRTTITPYGHGWCCHWGEMYERSKTYISYFQPDDVLETRQAIGGGLKFAMTQALERENLIFFHNYFQTMSRRPKDLMEESGFQQMRKIFNSETCDRSKYFCQWCGKGFVYQKRHSTHEDECLQAPPPLRSDSVYLEAKVRLAER